MGVPKDKNKGSSGVGSTAPELTGTLWKCGACGAFVTIHCDRILGSAICPACSSGPMQFCASREDILELAAEASGNSHSGMIQFPPPKIQRFD